MRHGHHFVLLGLVFLVTLLASAAHASGVQLSSAPPRASALAAICASHAESDVDNTHTGILIARETTSRLQTIRPPHEHDALIARGFTQPASPASFFPSVARTCALACTAAQIYALHPRPPTLSTRA